MLDRARAVVAMALAGRPVTRLRVLRDGNAALRTAIAACGIGTGVLPALAEAPARAGDLADELDVVDVELFRAFLRVLDSSGLVREKDGRWQVTSRGRAVLDDGLARAAAIAFGSYYTELYRGLLGQLRGGPARGDLDEHADTIAVLSRGMQPLVDQSIIAAVAQVGPTRVLDVGCGTGEQLSIMLAEAPQAYGVGVDIAPDVVEIARARLAAAGLQERSTVLAADIEGLPDRIDDLGGPVDLLLLANVLYYWPNSERVRLLRLLCEMVRPGGSLLLITTVSAPDLFTRHLDLLLRAQGRDICLPSTDEMRRQLAQAGLRPGPVRVAPGLSLVTVMATRMT